MQEQINLIDVGHEIPLLTKTAYMPIDPQGRNAIHTDDYAKDFGMRGALVGGSTLLSYVLEMLYGYFGRNWMEHGQIKVSFIGGGAINGDELTAHGLVTAIEPEGDKTRTSLDVWLENQDQAKILVGRASYLG
ncbi:MAG: MaoC family dehydratase [Deltaproteobacteria bacterium]|nr:MaoC family dehydratase [Deltaproteobacteria bacterium]